MKGILSKRKKDSHKGDYGKVGIIAGSRGMTGAAYLVAKSALRTGSGLVYSLVPQSLETIMSIKLTEAIIKAIYDGGTGHFAKESYKDIIDNLTDVDVVALGPGMGLDHARVSLVGEIIQHIDIPMVIDAGGLNCLSRDMDLMERKKGPMVITPHLGEMARLINKDMGQVKEKREYYARFLAEKYNLVVVLKGYKTIVCKPEGQVYVNNTGNPGMATAGSGDVLTGIIISLMGQGIDPFESAKLGVYLHGLAGDLAKKDKGEYGLIASDIVEAIPHGIKLLNN